MAQIDVVLDNLTRNENNLSSIRHMDTRVFNKKAHIRPKRFLFSIMVGLGILVTGLVAGTLLGHYSSSEVERIDRNQDHVVKASKHLGDAIGWSNKRIDEIESMTRNLSSFIYENEIFLSGQSVNNIILSILFYQILISNMFYLDARTYA